MKLVPALGRRSFTGALAALLLAVTAPASFGQTAAQIEEYRRLEQAKDFKGAWAFLEKNHPQWNFKRLVGLSQFLWPAKEEEGTRQGRYIYKYQTRILAAANADPATDSKEQIAAKISAMWKAAEAYGLAGSKVTVIDKGKTSYLKQAALKRFEPFIDDAIAWGINLNAVDEWDDATPLDYLQKRIEMTGDQDPAPLKQYYAMLRKAGAKHKAELLASGDRKADEVIQAEKIVRLRQDADAGDVLAMFTLSKIYLKGDKVPVNDQEGMRWWDRACKRAVDLKDYRKIVGIGYSYYPDDNSGGFDPYFWNARYHDSLNNRLQPDGKKAYAWVKMAADANDPDGIYWAARCRIMGVGVPQDRQAGIAMLVPLAFTFDHPAGKLITETYLEMKDMANFARWMRVLPPLMTIGGMNVEDWFKLKRIPQEGPKPRGWPGR